MNTIEKPNENGKENENGKDITDPESPAQHPHGDSAGTTLPPQKENAETDRSTINRRQYSMWELIRHREYDTIHPDDPDPGSRVLAGMRTSAWTELTSTDSKLS